MAQGLAGSRYQIQCNIEVLCIKVYGWLRQTEGVRAQKPCWACEQRLLHSGKASRGSQPTLKDPPPQPGGDSEREATALAKLRSGQDAPERECAKALVFCDSNERRPANLLLHLLSAVG